jgi:predicted nucleic acid-binding protein
MTDASPYGGRHYLVDTSAWIKIGQQPADVRNVFYGAIRAGQLSVCSIVLLELLRGTHPQHFDAVQDRFENVPYRRMTRDIGRAAVDAQRKLATKRPDGLHRGISPGDFLIAATAQEYVLGVLHCDGDFDSLSDEDVVSFESRWITDV